MPVSAFSDESWGGDPANRTIDIAAGNVSAFSDESWGGDPQQRRHHAAPQPGFSIL